MPKGFLSLQKIEVVRWPVRMSESAVPHVLYSDEMRRGQGAIRNPLSLEAMAIRERRGDGGCGSEVAVARRETRRSDDCSDPKAKNKNATKDTKLAKKKKSDGIVTFSSTHTKGRRRLLAADAERDRTKTECDDDGGREVWAGPGETRLWRRAGLDERRHRLVESVEQVLAREQLLDGGIDLRVQLAQVLKARDGLVQ